MKNYLLIIILTIFSLISFANSEEKISIVDMEYLLENSIAGKYIKTKLEKVNKKKAIRVQKTIKNFVNATSKFVIDCCSV